MPDVRAAENKASELTMGLWVSEGQFASVITKKLAGCGAASSPPRGLSRISGPKESNAEVPTHLCSTDMEMQGKMLLRRASLMKYKPGSRGVEGFIWVGAYPQDPSFPSAETTKHQLQRRIQELECWSLVWSLDRTREYLVAKRPW
jgi:hypothetical protein